MRAALQTFFSVLLVSLFVLPAFALASEQWDLLLEDASRYAEEETAKAETLPVEQRRALYDAVLKRIDQNLADCKGIDAEGLTEWGDLCVGLGETVPEDGAAVFLDRAALIFEKARGLDRKEEHAWAGLAEVHHVRAERAAKAGNAAEARKQAEAGFAVFKEGTALLPNSNFLFYMWGSNLVLRAYEVDAPESRALREEGIARFIRAIEIEPDDLHAQGMAGTAYLRIVEDLPPDAGDRVELLRKAEFWHKKAFARDPGYGCPPLAEVHALLREEAALRDTLEQCARSDNLPDLSEEYFDFVRDKDWFRSLAEGSR